MNKLKIENELLGKFLEHTFPGITKEVDEFLLKTPYNRTTPLGKLERFELSVLEIKRFYAVPEGLDEKKLSIMDVQYNEKLMFIGKKYGIGLSLPFWAFVK